MRERKPSTIEERIAGFEAVRPPGFIAPRRFEELLRQGELPDIDPWWWLIEFDESVRWWSETIKTQYPSRPPLVPFAKHGGTDDVFCFDGADLSGNPRVFIVHTFASPGWENRGYWDDFDVFMEAAEEEHADWLREEAEDDTEG
ncbi:hypothetical protein [Microbacterium terrisoli]|uniref:hypothetical protein n=1 Tax=Microbacterium terrisoli TaxID=3242192 RepID=UPI002805BE84|nr:hypothetical protein [Microbacterium protaetiae]